MKDHVEIGHLTKYDAFRVNRNYEFCDNCKVLSCSFYLKDEMKIAMFAHFKEYHGNHKQF